MMVETWKKYMERWNVDTASVEDNEIRVPATRVEIDGDGSPLIYGCSTLVIKLYDNAREAFGVYAGFIGNDPFRVAALSSEPTTVHFCNVGVCHIIPYQVLRDELGYEIEGVDGLVMLVHNARNTGDFPSRITDTLFDWFWEGA